MAAREKTQADFDLEKMFEMLDEALTSQDERVQSALRGLLTIVALTRTQDDGTMAVETKHGPLRQMQDDLQNVIRRLNNLENQMRQPYTPAPYQPGYPATGQKPAPPAPGAWWGIDPNMPYTTSKTSSSSSYTPPGPYLTDDDNNAKISIKLTK
jgi:hypothetical protein